MSKVLPVFVGLGVIVFGLYVVWKITAISKVSCVLENHPISTETPICTQLQELIGTPLFFRNFTRDSQVAQLLYVAETKEAFDVQSVSKSLVGEVVFYLSDQPPLYRIQHDNEWFLAAQSGELRENNPQLLVPAVIDSGRIYQEKNMAVHHFITALLQPLNEEQRQKIVQIELFAADLIEIQSKDFPLILMELTDDSAPAARRLKVVLSEFSPGEVDTTIQEIDLRFSLPVLRTYESTRSSKTLIDSQNGSLL